MSRVSAAAGELGKLQSAAARERGGSESAAMLAALAAAPTRSAADSRGHLETNMAAAQALESPQEYRRWLLTYARFLSGAAEPARFASCAASELAANVSGNRVHEASGRLVCSDGKLISGP